MAQVSLTVNGRAYQVACEDGEEEHLNELARYLNQRVEELVESVGQVGEGRLLLMAALLIADELSEAYDELDDVRAKLELRPMDSGAHTRASARAIETLAARLEDIAARVEST